MARINTHAISIEIRRADGKILSEDDVIAERKVVFNLNDVSVIIDYESYYKIILQSGFEFNVRKSEKIDLAFNGFAE